MDHSIRIDRAVVTAVLLLVCLGAAQAQELRDLDVRVIDELPAAPLVMADYPESAYLVFRSSLADLVFESNWIIMDDLSRPEEGRYVLVVDTVRQMVRISVPDRYRYVEIQVPRLNAREAMYYAVEPAHQALLNTLREHVAEQRYQEAVTELNTLLSIDDLTRTQRVEAYYTLALAYAGVNRAEDMQEALRRLLAINPTYEAQTVGDPAPVRAYLTIYRDSLQRLPPAPPLGVQGAFRPSGVRIAWERNTEPDLAGYQVYRRIHPSGDDELLTSLNATATSFLDVDVARFQTYAYRVVAFDDYQPPNESEPSAPVVVRAIPPLSERITVETDTTSPAQHIGVFQRQDSSLMISYALTGPVQQTYDVDVALSSNGGQSFTIRARSVTGDIGSQVPHGDNKVVVWTWKRDYPQGLQGRGYVLRVRAVPRPIHERIDLIAEPDSLVASLQWIDRADSAVYIAYQLAEDTRGRYRVGLTISQPDSSESELELRAVEGDVGRNVRGASEKRIAWQWLSDVPDGFVGRRTVRLHLERQTGPSGRFWLFTAGATLAAGSAALLLINDDKPVANAPPGRPN